MTNNVSNKKSIVSYPTVAQQTSRGKKKKNQPLSLLGLPQETLTHIVGYLSARDLVALSLANRVLNSLSMDNYLWKNLCFWERFPTQKTSEDAKQVYKHCMEQKVNQFAREVLTARLCNQANISSEKQTACISNVKAPPLDAEIKREKMYRMICSLALKLVKNQYKGLKNNKILDTLRFILACQTGDIKIVQKAQTDLNLNYIVSCASLTGLNTPMYYALQANNPELIQFLFGIGLEPTSEDLESAIRLGSLEGIALILDKNVAVAEDHIATLLRALSRLTSVDDPYAGLISLCHRLCDLYPKTATQENTQLTRKEVVGLRTIKDVELVKKLFSIFDFQLTFLNPLNEFVRKGKLDIVTYLVDQGLSVDQEHFNAAFASGSQEMVNYISSKGQFEPDDATGRDVLRGNNLAIIREFIQKWDYRFSILDLTFLSNDSEGNKIWQFLLEEGRISHDLNSEEDKERELLLWKILTGKNRSLLIYLYEKNVLKLQGRGGAILSTAERAVKKRLKSQPISLRAHPLSLNATDGFNQILERIVNLSKWLHRKAKAASHAELKERLELLLKWGAIPNEVSFTIALYSQNIEYLQLIVDKGAPIPKNAFRQVIEQIYSLQRGYHIQNLQGVFRNKRSFKNFIDVKRLDELVTICTYLLSKGARVKKIDIKYLEAKIDELMRKMSHASFNQFESEEEDSFGEDDFDFARIDEIMQTLFDRDEEIKALRNKNVYLRLNCLKEVLKIVKTTLSERSNKHDKGNKKS